MRLRSLALLAAAAATLIPVDAAADVSGLSVSPAHTDPANPATRAYFIRSVAPGGTFADQVKVTNTGSKPLKVFVSAVDGLTGTTSGAVYANRQDPVRKAGAWVTPDRSSLSVPGRATVLVGFKVRVPADAEAGDHLAGVAFEDQAPSTSGSGFQVTTVVRAVIGVLMQVPGPAAFHVRLYSASIQPLNEESHLASVVIKLGDDGLLLGKPKLTVALTGPNGYHNTVTRTLDTLLPGDTIPFPFNWPDNLETGTYAIAVSATAPGMSDTAQLNTTAQLSKGLQGISQSGAAVAATPASGPPLWMVIAMIAGLLLLLAIVGLLALIVLRSPRRQGPHGRTDEPAH